jgi:hypothetical protein
LNEKTRKVKYHCLHTKTGLCFSYYRRVGKRARYRFQLLIVSVCLCVCPRNNVAVTIQISFKVCDNLIQYEYLCRAEFQQWALTGSNPMILFSFQERERETERKRETRVARQRERERVARCRALRAASS